MLYKKNDYDKTREIKLPENITSKDKIAFLELINNFINSNFKCLTLDLKQTKTIDSAGLGFLLIALQEANNNSKQLILKTPSEHISKVFTSMNFNSIFTIEKN